jgi:RHS repeat-associated protein
LENETQSCDQPACGVAGYGCTAARGASTKFIWDGETVLSEIDLSNVTQALYTLHPEGFGNLISQYRPLPTPASNYFLFDGLGSTDRLTDASGTVTDNYVYQAFGTIASSLGSSTNPFRFVGKQGYYFNSDTVQYYLRARFYDPVTGRFRNLDPRRFRASDLNLYRYVENNCVNASDPSGLWSLRDIAIYGNYCGPASGPEEPIDCVDRGCKVHDACLATIWQWITPGRQLYCDTVLCYTIDICIKKGECCTFACIGAANAIKAYVCLWARMIGGPGPIPIIPYIP